MHTVSPSKRLRLNTATYRSGVPFHVTIVTRMRQPLLAPNTALAQATHQLLERDSKSRTLYAWVIMPDHVHLLLCADDLLPWVRRFKADVSRSRSRPGSSVWQPSFYDRALRRSESLRDTARYIWLNPVRRGLSTRAASFPFSGSHEWHNWRRWVDDPFTWT